VPERERGSRAFPRLSAVEHRDQGVDCRAGGLRAELADVRE
jgi:hypothetical protein